MTFATYFPATIEPETDDLGRTTYAIRYADGRIVHRLYKSYEAAQIMIDRLAAHQIKIDEANNKANAK